MSAIKSLEDLKRVKAEALEKRTARTAAARAEVVIGMGSCGIAAGAGETKEAILDMIEEKNLTDIFVTQTGCIGLCEWEPIVEVAVGGSPKVSYGKVTADKVQQIIEQHLMKGETVSELVIPA